MQIRRKLSLTFSAIILGGLILLVGVLTYLTHDYLVDLHSENLRKEASALAKVLGYLPEPHFRSSLDSLAATLKNELRIRVSFISADGIVLADSDVDFASIDTVENHLQRPELQEARNIGWGSARRISNTVHEPFLYVAIHELAPSTPVAFVRLAMPMRIVEGTVQDLRVLIIVGGLFILAITVVATWIFAHRITTPLQDYMRILRAIENGDYSMRTRCIGSDEIGRLGAHINETADKIEHEFKRMHQLERVRTEFIGNTSHELKTPIASIKGYLETLLSGGLEDKEVNKKFLERARFNADRLQLLVNDLIQIARIESGEMRMSFRYFDGLQLLRELHWEFQNQFAGKRLDFRLDIPETREIKVRGDKDRLKQALTNLLTNALKYTDEGLVTLGLRDSRHTVTIFVEDTGPGIPREFHSRIFERFFRVDRDRSRAVGGTGLGLAIVKHILSAHDTQIHVESDGHTGSKFWFRLHK
ncbi:MAG TPA: ATP-binding protein [bacterium]|nr:ATP-binding protein [bacterium]